MARTRRKINALQRTPPVSEEKPRRIYRAGGYVRLSMEDNGKPGADTIEAQRELVESFILSQNDMSFCGFYCDNGHTGTDFDRPAFQRLMEDIRAGKIDCVVVKDLSRFGRNYLETGNYLERVFPFLDVRFVAVSDNFDTLTAERASSGYIIPLKNIVNELYSKDISRKIRPALAARQQRGEFIGTWAPYGYRKCGEDPHRIEPDPETAPVVKEIFQLRLSGMSVAQIARRLNERGIPTSTRYHYLKGDTKSERYANSVWQGTVVKLILENEVYLGHMIQGRKRADFYNGQKQRYLPKEQWTVVRDTHPPIIDEETFQAVQRMAEDRCLSYCARLGCYDHLGTVPNILKGLVFCADCKRPLVRYKNVTNKGTNLYYTFICPSHSRDPASCPKKSLHETELFQLLWNTLQNWINIAGELEKLVRQHNRSAKVSGQADSLAKEISAAQQALNRVKALHDSLYQNYVDKLMSEMEYVELREQYRAEIKAAEARLSSLEEEVEVQRRQTVQNPWLTTFTQFAGTSELTGDMAHALISRIEVDAENHVTVFMRYRNEYLALIRLLDLREEGLSWTT